MIKSMIQVIKIQINYILELNRQCAKKENWIWTIIVESHEP